MLDQHKTLIWNHVQTDIGRAFTTFANIATRADICGIYRAGCDVGDRIAMQPMPEEPKPVLCANGNCRKEIPPGVDGACCHECFIAAEAEWLDDRKQAHVKVMELQQSMRANRITHQELYNELGAIEQMLKGGRG